LSRGRGNTPKRLPGADNTFHLGTRLRLSPHESVGARGALRILDSVLRMVRWRRNTKALHLVKQRGAL
jgi:hypothetical protein